MVEQRPIPLLATLGEDDRRSLSLSANEGADRLNNGESIQALTYDQVLGLCATREVELHCYMTELWRRRAAMNN